MADKGHDRPGLGEILSFLRWLAGLTQDALALLSRTDRGQLSRYEQGETPQPGTLQRILAAMGVRPRFLAHLANQGIKLPGNYFDPSHPL